MRSTAQSLGEALSLYEKAITLDPEFADAYAGYARAIVDVLGFDFQPLMLSAVARQRAYEAAGRALELNPQSPRAYAVLGILQMLDGESTRRSRRSRRPSRSTRTARTPELNLAIVLTYAGQNPEALAAMERVLQLDPKPRAQVYDYYGFVLYMNRRYEEALQALSQVGPEERSDLGLETLAMANARLGRMAEAHEAVAAILKKIPESEPRRSPRRVRPPSAAGGSGPPAGRASRGGAAGVVLRFPRPAGGPAGRRRPSAPWPSSKTWIGHQHNGAPFVMQLSANGDFALRAQNEHDRRQVHARRATSSARNPRRVCSAASSAARSIAIPEGAARRRTSMFSRTPSPSGISRVARDVRHAGPRSQAGAGNLTSVGAALAWNSFASISGHLASAFAMTSPGGIEVFLQAFLSGEQVELAVDDAPGFRIDVRRGFLDAVPSAQKPPY